jgi:hypothetical protein
VLEVAANPLDTSLPLADEEEVFATLMDIMDNHGSGVLTKDDVIGELHLHLNIIEKLERSQKQEK